MNSKLLFLWVPLLIAGCASSGNDKAAKTSAALSKTAEQVSSGHALVNRSLATLNDLVEKPRPDLRPQFEAFNAAVDDLVAMAEDVGKTAEAMKASGASYFTKWDEELATIQNENLRARGTERKAEVAARFEEVGKRYDAASQAFRPFMADLRDVQTYLSTDLTSGGLAAIKDAAAKANSDAVPLMDALGKLTNEFKALGVALSPQTAAAVE